MDDAIEAKEKWIQSAAAWIDGMRRGDVNRTHLLDPVMLDAAGDVEGKRVLDIGCGEGRFCRMMIERGAHVSGIDLTPTLVAEASRLDSIGRYLTASAEELPFETSSFDLTISYIVLVDVPDFRVAIREMARVTKPGGRLIVANLSSFASTTDTGWVRDANGAKLHYPIDRYLEERGLRLSWAGLSVINWHRPLQDYMKAYLECGLILRSFAEPSPTDSAVTEVPGLSDGNRVPLFNVMVWEKP